MIRSPGMEEFEPDDQPRWKRQEMMMYIYKQMS